MLFYREYQHKSIRRRYRSPHFPGCFRKVFEPRHAGVGILNASLLITFTRQLSYLIHRFNEMLKFGLLKRLVKLFQSCLDILQRFGIEMP